MDKPRHPHVIRTWVNPRNSSRPVRNIPTTIHSGADDPRRASSRPGGTRTQPPAPHHDENQPPKES
jgi:hypothetical protein